MPISLSSPTQHHRSSLLTKQVPKKSPNLRNPRRHKERLARNSERTRRRLVTNLIKRMRLQKGLRWLRNRLSKRTSRLRKTERSKPSNSLNKENRPCRKVSRLKKIVRRRPSNSSNWSKNRWNVLLKRACENLPLSTQAHKRKIVITPNTKEEHRSNPPRFPRTVDRKVRVRWKQVRLLNHLPQETDLPRSVSSTSNQTMLTLRSQKGKRND